MATLSYPVLQQSEIAAADVGAHLAIGYDGNLAAAAGPMHGMSQCAAKTNERLPLTVIGIEGAVAGATITARGTPLEVGADGKLVPHAAGIAVARSLAAAAADDVIEVYVLPH